MVLGERIGVGDGSCTGEVIGDAVARGTEDTPVVLVGRVQCDAW